MFDMFKKKKKIIAYIYKGGSCEKGKGIEISIYARDRSMVDIINLLLDAYKLHIKSISLNRIIDVSIYTNPLLLGCRNVIDMDDILEYVRDALKSKMLLLCILQRCANGKDDIIRIIKELKLVGVTDVSINRDVKREFGISESDR